VLNRVKERFHDLDVATISTPHNAVGDERVVMVSRRCGLMVGALPRMVISRPPSLAPVLSRLRRASLVRAYEHVARDRGGSDHVERIDPGGEGARMHRDADGLIGLV
jgi:hypothetical protein